MSFIATGAVKQAGKHFAKNLAKKAVNKKRGKGQHDSMSSKNKALLIVGCGIVGLVILLITSFVGAIFAVGQFLSGDMSKNTSDGTACEIPADYTGDPFLYVCPEAPGGGSSSKGVTNGGWGGYSNGLIPDSSLASPSFNSTARFRPDAAAAMSAMNIAFQAATGGNIAITDSYRSLAGQYACTASKGNLCAPPGYSNHGWGLAADLGGGINTLISSQHAWMKANAGTYGWIHPSWAEPGGSKPEPWHWEYIGNVVSSSGGSLAP